MDEASKELLKNLEGAIKEMEKKVNLIYQVIVGTPAVREESRPQQEPLSAESRKYGWEKEMPFDEVTKKMGGKSGVLK